MSDKSKLAWAINHLQSIGYFHRPPTQKKVMVLAIQSVLMNWGK